MGCFVNILLFTLNAASISCFHRILYVVPPAFVLNWFFCVEEELLIICYHIHFL